jgi:predicted phage baseplate assembly protein
MLQSRNLDDQQFEDIVREAVGRLPWLCPVWTDHNSHDPGITILELMAWFKESQQYEMNRIGPEMKAKLMELAGVKPRPERAAECALLIPPETSAHTIYSTLETPEGIVFELDEEIPAVRCQLVRAVIERAGKKQDVDITEMMFDASVCQPFAFGGEAGSALRLEFAPRPEGTLRMWFDIESPEGVERNEPDEDTEPPRTLVWELAGCGAVTPLADETFALSRSGYVTLPVPQGWRAGADGVCRLTLRQTEAGCEETVRLRALSVCRYRAMQTESRARAYRFAVKAQKACGVTVRSAQAGRAETAVFLRAGEGWQQIGDYALRRRADGLLVTLDTTGAADDGEDNLLVVCMDPVRTHDLLFDATGRPGESFRLNLDGKGVLTERLTLMCQTLCEDGVVRPALWQCVEDLSVCSPRDRVFVYDKRRELISVGDGTHGALIVPGEGAVMVVEELVSLCAEGNIPANAGLYFTDGGEAVGNDAAHFGCDAETLAAARGRLLNRLRDTRKCLSAKDYERIALRTPGLRVAGARALPDYDVRNKHQKTSAFVSVAVLPAGDAEMPTPDERFLAAVSRQLERYRPICIRTEAISVRYADVAISVRLWADKSYQEETLLEKIRAHFAPSGARIGVGVTRDEITALLQKLPGVLQIERVELRGLDQNSYQTALGDLTVMPDTILHLTGTAVSLAKDRR